jgi:hypothetical protein
MVAGVSSDPVPLGGFVHGLLDPLLLLVAPLVQPFLSGRAAAGLACDPLDELFRNPDGRQRPLDGIAQSEPLALPRLSHSRRPGEPGLDGSELFWPQVEVVAVAAEGGCLDRLEVAGLPLISGNGSSSA